MDPFTQRMLERASARREKLNTLLSNTGHDVSTRRSPLRDANAILAQAPVITGHIAKSPSKPKPNLSITKSPIKVSNPSSSPKPSPVKAIKFSPSKSIKKDTINKENGDNSQESSVRSKLQRLGKLYSDDNTELSSPIHRTEEKFAIDDDSNERKSGKTCARLNRLAALASEIKNWEDDLSHPSLQVKPSVSKAEKIQARMNEQVKGVANNDPQPSTSGYKPSCSNSSCSPSNFAKRDKNALEKDSSFSSDIKSSPRKFLVNTQSDKVTPKKSMEIKSKESSKSPDKGSKPINTPSVGSSRVINSRFGYNSSPKSSPINQSPGSVLSKASIFETKTTSVKTKDPAEMTLSERKALFERNKGEALIPKAPLSMSIPTKMLQDKEKSSQSGSSLIGDTINRLKNDSGKAVGVQRSIFESGIRTQELENNILQKVQDERNRELEMLRSRFNKNKNKEMVQSVVTSSIRTSESSEGIPNSPKNSPICPVKPTPATDQIPPPPPLPIPQASNVTSANTNKFPSIKRQVSHSPPKSKCELKKEADVKRLRVNAPKPGHLYPDLEHIESSTTDTETYTEGEYYIRSDDNETYTSDDEEDGDDDIGNTSLGRSILHAVTEQVGSHKKRQIDSDPDSTSDLSVLNEMEEYLDECMALENMEEGPTPPKINRGVKSPSASSHSFRYTQGSSYKSPIKIVTSKSSPMKNEQYVVDGDSQVPLLHSVSTYRKQQSQTPKTPARVISHVPDVSDDSSQTDSSSGDRESILVQEKVKRLLDEIGKQQTIIGQASQALNLCNSTVEFSGSREQVEGERLLLVATHKRQAALNEIQRLKVEGTLRPVVPGAPEVQESGSLTISAITLPLKRDAFRNVDRDACIHFVCLVRYLDNVIATPVVQAEKGDSCIRFPSTLKLNDLYSDFKVTIEVYSLQTRAEILPHEIKYHIHSSGSSNSSAKKSSGKTPKKLKGDSKLIMPSVQSPAGPSAVRSTSFALAGYVIFSLKEVHRQQFTLNKVPYSSPLEGRLQMHVSCELTVSVDHHGFLTMFEDVSGFGAWHRRWCLLKGATLSYWKYPDDERKKTPIGSLDLQSVCTTNVGLVSRDICARPNTFLLETKRPAQPGDVDSLVMIKDGSETTVRFLLSADTKEERLEWCSKLNKTLHLIRAWGGTST